MMGLLSLSSMREPSTIPRLVSVVARLIGSYDLLRGFMHTIVLNYSATNIAVLDLTTSTARDQLKLLGAFGVSNLETGIAMILMALFARKLALIMLGVIPLIYVIGYFAIKANSGSAPPSHANWGGAPLLVVYLAITCATFIAALVVMRATRRHHQLQGVDQ
jgi:hypothetical protein